MNWIRRHKVMTVIAGLTFLSYVLLLMEVEQAAITFQLLSFAAIIWVGWTLLCVVFPALKRKKKEEHDD